MHIENAAAGALGTLPTPVSFAGIAMGEAVHFALVRSGARKETGNWPPPRAVSMSTII
ncbi:hypothetical protein [Streptomyces asiaticus]|uniref:hypothetical protein n=1 Tax=Streptomyces asiaticus TaxID=114695 RepID=UPI003F671223